jgi:magnesium transporter
MRRILNRKGDGSVDTSLAVSDIPAALLAPDGLLWIDFVAEPPEACGPLLAELFRFHPLAIDDALQESHVPKLDDWESYLYLVLHGISFDLASSEMLTTQELDIFLGPRYVVTHHEQAFAPIDKVWNECRRPPESGGDGRVMGRGAARLLYHIIDEVVAMHMPAVDALEEEMERVEDGILATPGPQTLPKILRIKRSLMHLRRIVAPQREVLNKLARDELSVIPPTERVYFRDIYDHLVRLYDIVEGLRDLAAGGLDTYLSVINNRMNEVMKTFTLITTLFMPISFLTGFFGMNFFSPESPPAGWTGRIVFGAICAAIVLIPALMFVWLKRRRWV